MKNRLKIFSKIILSGTLAVGCMSLFGAGVASAEEPEQQSDRYESLDDLSFLEMLHSVDTDKASSLIQKFQHKEATGQLLKNTRFGPKGKGKVELYRNKEVILATIPADELFAPNATELLAKADGYLAPFKRYLKSPDMYRVLLVMHTDNTGSEAYRDKLTIDRVNAVFDWFDGQGVDTSYLFSYALSDDIPLKPNTTLDNRRDNRRLEIYLVPGTKMVEQARRGSIAF